MKNGRGVVRKEVQMNPHSWSSLNQEWEATNETTSKIDPKEYKNCTHSF